MKLRTWAANVIGEKPAKQEEPGSSVDPSHSLPVDVTLDKAGDRVGQLDKYISDGERELSRLDEKYDRLLEEANKEKGHKREKKLRMAHDIRLEMERLDQRLEEAKDRYEAWQDVEELMVRSMDVGVDVDEEPVATLEEMEFDKLREAAEQADREQKERKAEIEELRNDVEAALDRNVDRERYRRVREEAAAMSGGGSVLERDEELAEDFEKVKQEN